MPPKTKPIYLLRRRARLVRELAVIESQLKRAGVVPVEMFPDIRRIQRAVCRRFDVTMPLMLSKVRTGRIAWPRMLAMYLTRRLTKRGLAEIGRAFERTAPDVAYAVKKAAARISVYSHLVKDGSELERELAPGVTRVKGAA